MDKKNTTKSARLTEIKKFLTKNLQTLSIPFLKTPPKVVETKSDAISPLPKTEKPKKKVEEQLLSASTTAKPVVKPLDVKSITTTLSLQPMSIMTKLGKIGATPMMSLVKPRLNAVVAPITAKLEPKATKAGGSEGAKITLLSAKNPTAPKEAALVGEDGPEKIVHSTGSVIPLSKMDKITENKPATSVKQTKITENKPAITLPQPQKLTLPTVFSSFAKITGGMVPTVLPKVAPRIKEMLSSAFPMLKMAPTTEIRAKQPSVVKTKAAETLINLTPKDKKQLLVMAQTNQISNKVEKDRDGKPVLTLPAYAEGRNMEKVEPQSIKQDKIQSAQNVNPVSSKMKQPSAVEPQKTNPLPPVEPAKNQTLSKELESPKKATESGNQSAQPAEQMNQQGDQQTPPVVSINTNGRSSSPTTINTITFEYDTFRKTSDYMSMLPEWRIRVG